MLARCLPLLIGILLALPAGGDPASLPPAPDFSAGFSRLAALGLPALDSKARWCTLPDSSGGEDYRFRELAKSLKGNGWSIPAADGKTLSLPAGALETVETGGTATASPPRGLLGGLFGGGGSSKPAAPAAADLAKDVRALIAAFHKNDEGNDPFSNGSRADGTVLGRVLLLATQIYQTGNTALANELAIAVFDLTPSRETAIDAAVSLIADHAYEAAAQAFFTSYDWAAYHRALTGLVEKFPRGWRARDAVAMLIPQVAKQAAGETPPVPSPTGVPLDPQALAALRQLTVKPAAIPAADDEKLLKRAGYELSSIPPNQRARVLAYLRSEGMGMRRYQGSSLWLLEPTDAKESDSSPLARITSLGVAALPVLAALVDDPYLTYLPNEKTNEGSSYDSPDEGDEERTFRIHASLKRPSTRGEIACDLLRQTLPDPSNESNEAGPDTLRDLALAFWKENPHASRDKLAAVFLREGSVYQIQAAATLFASSADPKSRQAFEAYILAADPAVAQFQSVQTYLTARKAAARTFFEAYSKLVRSQGDGTAEDDNSGQASYQIKQAGGAEKILKRLEKIVAGVSPRVLAKEIAQGKPKEAPAAIRSLIEMMKDDTPVQRLYALLEGAADAGDPLIRCQFLQATYQVGWRGNCPDDGGVGDDGDAGKPVPAAERKLGDAEIKVWRQLLADTRDIPENRGEKATIGDLAAAMLMYSINPESSQTISLAAPVLQKKPVELFREHATARLDGTPPPPLPDASHVKSDRLKAIISEAGAKPAADIHPYLKTLTPDERAAWLEWTRKPGDVAIPQSVKDLRFLVVARDDRGYYGYFPDTKGAGLIDVGFMITSANLKTYVESLAKEVAKHSRTFLQIHPALFGPGLQVSAVVPPLAQQTPEPKADDPEAAQTSYQPKARDFFRDAVIAFKDHDSAEAVILITAAKMRSKNVKAAWLIEKDRIKPADPGQQTDFDTVLQALADADDFAPPQFTIQILTKADADKMGESSPGNPFGE